MQNKQQGESKVKSEPKMGSQTQQQQQQQKPRAFFQSTRETLKSALKSSKSLPQPVLQPKTTNVENKIEEIQRKLSALPASEITKGPGLEVIRETSHGIETTLSGTGLTPLEREKLLSDQREMMLGQREIIVDRPQIADVGEKFEDASDQFKDQPTKIEQGENLEEIAPSVTPRRDIDALKEETSPEPPAEELPQLEGEEPADEVKPEPVVEFSSDSNESTEEGESDLEIREFEPKQNNEPLPTMEQERESTVEEEAKWVKEHHMEPEEEQPQNGQNS